MLCLHSPQDKSILTVKTVYSYKQVVHKIKELAMQSKLHVINAIVREVLIQICGNVWAIFCGGVILDYKIL